MLKKTLAWIFPLAIMLLSGCASTSVQTRLANDFKGPVNKVFIVVKVSGNWSEIETKQLCRELGQKLGFCLQNSIHVISPLTLDHSEIQKGMDSYNAPYTLLLEQTMEKVKSQWGSDIPSGFIFNARLVQKATERVVWSANLNSSGNAGIRQDYTNSMVKKLVNTMERDGLISCNEG